jgi:hypothetical protein
LAHNGKILQEHYSNPFILRDLIDLGAISSLGNQIGKAHPFSKFEINKEDPDYDKLIALHELADKEGWTTFYARDRGEDLVKHTYKDFQEYTREAQREEYDYILRNVNGVATWFVSFYGTDGEYLTMADAFEFQKAREAEEA